MKHKVIRITTVPISLKVLLKGQLRFINQHEFEIIGISSSENNLLKDISKQEGIRTIELKMTRFITPIQDVISVIKLCKILNVEKPFMIHSHTPKAGIVAMIAGKLTGIPIRLHTVAGLPVMESKGVKKHILNLVEKITYHLATKIYPNSKGLEKYIINNKLANQNKLKVISNGSSNGINTLYFDAKNIKYEDIKTLKCNLQIKDSDFIFLYLGRIVKDKGINELVESFISLKNKNVKLILVGNYEKKIDPIEEYIHQQIIYNPNIIEVGFVSDVRPFLSLCNCLVLPSYREGFPNVVLQALSMNKPCIVTNINGCNEIIKTNYNGIIVEPKNIDQLTNAMKKISSEKEFVKSISKNCRKSVVNKFDHEIIWNDLLSEYRQLIKHYNEKINN